jgi:flagellin-like protein
MRQKKVDDSGVSPIIATLLMIGITVTLASSVFLLSNEYMEMAEGEPELFMIEVELDSDGIIEAGSEGRGPEHTYSAVKIESINRMIDWSKYKVTVDGGKVFTVPSRMISQNQVPDASDDPGPRNSGKTPVGEIQYFTEERFRDDLESMVKGQTYRVIIVNLAENRVVWSDDVRAK